MFLLFSLFLSLILCSVSFIFWRLTFWSRRGIPNDLTSRSDRPFHVSDLESHQKFGKVVGYYEGLEPCLSVTDPQLIKKILVTEFQNFADHRAEVNPNEPLHKGLFFLPYSNWKRTRTILSPSFTSGKLKSFKPIIDLSLEEMIRHLESKAKQNPIIDFRQYTDCLMFDIISKSSFGLNLDPFNNPDNPILQSSKRLFQFEDTLITLIAFVYPKIAKIFDFRFFDGDSQMYIVSSMKRVINERLAKGVQSNDLLQNLLDESVFTDNNRKFSSFEKLNEEEVFANSLNMMLAGFETMSTQLIYMVNILSQYPEHHDTLLDEIRSTFSEECEISYDKLHSMPLLDAFVKEVMRIECSVNRIDRRVVRDCRIGNISVSKDMTVVIPIWALHRDPDNFDEPDVFKPERFLPENESKIKEYSYLPFATGPRNCIGMRLAMLTLKHCLVRILTKFRFERCDRTQELKFFNLSQTTNMQNFYIKLVPSSY